MTHDMNPIPYYSDANAYVCPTKPIHTYRLSAYEYASESTQHPSRLYKPKVSHGRPGPPASKDVGDSIVNANALRRLRRASNV